MNLMMILERMGQHPGHPEIPDFATALTSSGNITDEVVFFGHAGDLVFINPPQSFSAIFVGNQEDPDNVFNLSLLNVGSLSNSKLGPSVKITINACNAGAGGRNSIAQLLALQLKRTVMASTVDMYFSSDSTPRRYKKGMTSPTSVPVYLVPNSTKPLTSFPIH